MGIHKLLSNKLAKNKALFVLISALVQGYWKSMIARKDVHGKVDKALRLIKQHCMMLTKAQKQEYNNKLTALSMSARQTATSFLCEFNISKCNAEESGFLYSNGQLVDMLLAAITKSKNPKYAAQGALYTAARARKPSLYFQYIEQSFFVLDFNLEKGPQKMKMKMSKHQAKMSSQTSVDTPSNKIGK